MFTPIFRWNGEYFGFICNGHLFDSKSNYLGWTESDGSVWANSGMYLGQLSEENYVLRSTTIVQPIPRVPRIPPIPPVPPVQSINRIGKIGRIGWDDALSIFGTD